MVHEKQEKRNYSAVKISLQDGDIYDDLSGAIDDSGQIG